jgi:uncharacterized protein (DUF1697 family)
VSAEKRVALLRGINVGSRNRIGMPDLVKLFTEAGCRDVTTFIQSGNVVFRASAAAAAKASVAVTRALAERFAVKSPIIVRTAGELAAVAKANPFLNAGEDPEADSHHVAFLSETPTAAQLAALDPARSPPHRFAVVGREIYLTFPGGLADTKLTNQYFDSKLKSISTMRNWRTVSKLVELAAAE